MRLSIPAFPRNKWFPLSHRTLDKECKNNFAKWKLMDGHRLFKGRAIAGHKKTIGVWKNCSSVPSSCDIVLHRDGAATDVVVGVVATTRPEGTHEALAADFFQFLKSNLLHIRDGYSTEGNRVCFCHMLHCNHRPQWRPP